LLTVLNPVEPNMPLSPPVDSQQESRYFYKSIVVWGSECNFKISFKSLSRSISS